MIVSLVMLSLKGSKLIAGPMLGNALSTEVWQALQMFGIIKVLFSKLNVGTENLFKGFNGRTHVRRLQKKKFIIDS